MASSARIEELEKKFNENPRRYFAPLANEYRKAGDVQQAIAICRTYVPQQPGHMSGHIVFGQALFEAGDHDEARGVFEAALGLDPENLIALRHLGDIAREHGEADDARAWYRRVLDADPRNDEVAALLTSVEAEQAAAADEPATWTEINPEQTLELPPDVLAAVPRDVSFANRAPSRSAGSPASSMGELFDGGDAEAEAAPDLPGGETIEFRSSSYVAPEGSGYVDEAAKTVPTFATETMAELYVQQGFYDQALSVYRELLTQHPGDPKLAERMEQLRRESAATPRPGAQAANAFDIPPTAHSAPDHRSVREFFNELALRQPRVRAAAPAETEAAVALPAAGEHEESAPVHEESAPGVVAEAAVVVPPAGEHEESAPVVVAEAAAETPAALSSDEEPPASEPPIATSAPDPAAESVTGDPAREITQLPRDLDAGFSDASYHETYSAEFGASALTVPDEVAEDEPVTGRGLFGVADQGADSFVVRPSGEADPFALLGFNTSESSEFDVTAFEASAVPSVPDAPADVSVAAGEEPAADTPVHVSGDTEGDSTGDAAGPAEDAAAHQAVAADSGPATDEEASPAAGFAEADVSPGAVSAQAPSDTPVSRAAMQTGSVNVLFPERPISAPDEAAAAALSSAFGGPSFEPEQVPAPADEVKAAPKAETRTDVADDAPGIGGSARPARNELSLDSVFRESPAASPDPRREPSAFSFDQFFGETPPGAASGTASGSASGSDSLLGDALDVGSADAEQFSNWLSGLKKK